MTKKSLVTKIATLESLRNDKDRIDAQIKELQSELIDHLDAMETKTLSVDMDGRPVTLTRVQAVRTKIDDTALRLVLDKNIWLKVTTRVLDAKKLEAHIASGEVDALTVSECTSEVLNSPYIKLS